MGAARLNVNMANPPVFHMPVELGLKFMAVVGTDGVNAERKLIDHIVDEIDGVFLGMTSVDFEGPDASRIVYRGVLIPFDPFFIGIFET